MSLAGVPEGEVARRLEADLPGRRELTELRVAELPELLARPSIGNDGRGE